MSHPLIKQLIIPDIIMPSQFYEARSHARSGEMLLLLAVLEDAFFVLNPVPHDIGRFRRYKEAKEAHAWFMLHDISGGPFSFANICATFDFDEAGLRSKARAKFRLLSPPTMHNPGQRAVPLARLNKSRYVQNTDPWLSLVEVRDEDGKLERRFSLPGYTASAALARQQGRIYIATDAWRTTEIPNSEPQQAIG